MISDEIINIARLYITDNYWEQVQHTVQGLCDSDALYEKVVWVHFTVFFFFFCFSSFLFSFLFLHHAEISVQHQHQKTHADTGLQLILSSHIRLGKYCDLSNCAISWLLVTHGLEWVIHKLLNFSCQSVEFMQKCCREKKNQITTLYKHGVEKRISEGTTFRTGSRSIYNI